MPYPDDLPWWIDYRMPAGPPLPTLPRRLVESVSSSGATNANVVRPHIPVGATAWREVRDGIVGPWRPLAEIPLVWLPFLERKGT